MASTGQSAKYNPKNSVVTEYLQRTLTQIKAKQDELLASYAESCISDVSSCLGQNGYSTSSTTTTSTSAKNIAINACRATIVTCMSVNGKAEATPTPDSMVDWVSAVIDKSTTSSGSSSGSSSGNDSGTTTVQPSNFSTCATCKNANFSWNGSACVDKINYSGITTGTMCTTSGGTWNPARCVWVAKNIPESTAEQPSNLDKIIDLWSRAPWQLKKIDTNYIEVTANTFSNVTACKDAIGNTIAESGTDLNYGDNNLTSPDWGNASCTEKACE